MIITFSINSHIASKLEQLRDESTNETSPSSLSLIAKEILTSHLLNAMPKDIGVAPMPEILLQIKNARKTTESVYNWFTENQFEIDQAVTSCLRNKDWDEESVEKIQKELYLLLLGVNRLASACQETEQQIREAMELFD